MRARGVTLMFARKGTVHGSGLSQTCWVTERTFGWLHRFKRLRSAMKWSPVSFPVRPVSGATPHPTSIAFARRAREVDAIDQPTRLRCHRPQLVADGLAPVVAGRDTDTLGDRLQSPVAPGSLPRSREQGARTRRAATSERRHERAART